MAKKPGYFILIFAFIWSTIVLLFDGFVGHAIVNQVRSQHFETTLGSILASEVSEHDGEDGPTYGADIRYAFHVDGQRHESDRVRFGAMSDSGGDWARQTVRDNPVGSTRTVYFDPSDPSLSVLQTGVDGQNWFMLMFLAPFNAVMIFLWSLAIQSRRPSPPAGGALILTEGERVLVKLNKTSRAAQLLFVIGGVPFAGVFIFGFLAGFAVDVDGVLTVVAIMIVASLWVVFKKPGRIKPDLIIDPAQGRLELPSGGIGGTKNWKALREWKKAGKPALIVQLEQLQRVVMSERVTTDSEGSNSTHYVTTLYICEADTGNTSEHDIGWWMLPHRADSFAEWLRSTLGAPGAA